MTLEHASTVVRSFQKCGITVASDGSQDQLINIEGLSDYTVGSDDSDTDDSDVPLSYFQGQCDSDDSELDVPLSHFQSRRNSDDSESDDAPLSHLLQYQTWMKEKKRKKKQKKRKKTKTKVERKTKEIQIKKSKK